MVCLVWVCLFGVVWFVWCGVVCLVGCGLFSNCCGWLDLSVIRKNWFVWCGVVWFVWCGFVCLVWGWFVWCGFVWCGFVCLVWVGLFGVGLFVWCGLVCLVWVGLFGVGWFVWCGVVCLVWVGLFGVVWFVWWGVVCLVTAVLVGDAGSAIRLALVSCIVTMGEFEMREDGQGQRNASLRILPLPSVAMAASRDPLLTSISEALVCCLGSHGSLCVCVA